MTQKRSVLIVDDHHLVRRGLKLILNDQDEIDFTVHEVDDGSKALKKFQEEKIDIVLMDITMPGMNGIDATKTILDYKSNARIIALSMHNETFLIKRMLEAGVSGYLLKDTETSELTKAIKTVLKGKQYFCNEVSLKLINEFSKGRDNFNDQKSSTFKISQRESQVLNLISKQYTNEEIAEELKLSKRTIDNHRQKMLLKFNVKNTAGLVMFGIKNHLID